MLPEHGVDVACVPVRSTAGHIGLAVVGSEVAGELELPLPLVLRDGQLDGARRFPLRKVMLHWWQRFPASLDVVIRKRSGPSGGIGAIAYLSTDTFQPCGRCHAGETKIWLSTRICSSSLFRFVGLE
jgi:hypothetical protein